VPLIRLKTPNHLTSPTTRPRKTATRVQFPATNSQHGRAAPHSPSRPNTTRPAEKRRIATRRVPARGGWNRGVPSCFGIVTSVPHFPLPSRGPIDVQEAEREKDSGGRYADETGYCLLSSICCPATMSARFWAISTAPLTKARFTGDNLVAASQPDSTQYRSERLSDPRSRCRRGPTFPSRRYDLPHRADGDGPLPSECSCRSRHTRYGGQAWLRLGTAIPSGPSPSPRLGAVPPVRGDLHLDLYLRSLHADRVARDAARRGCAQHGAGLDAIDGPMPRARDLLARHLALGERAAAVRAGV